MANTATPDVILFKNSGDPTNGYILFYSNQNIFQVNFQEIPSSISDARSMILTEQNIAKRTEPLLIYNSTGFRQISLTLKFGVLQPPDAYDMFGLVALLRQSVYPTERGVPMYCRLNLGPWFVSYTVTAEGSNGFNLSTATLTEDIDGMAALIEGYTITPSSDRLTDPSTLQRLFPGTINASTKLPSSFSADLRLKVFSKTVWSGGSTINVGTETEKMYSMYPPPDGSTSTSMSPSTSTSGGQAISLQSGIDTSGSTVNQNQPAGEQSLSSNQTSPVKTIAPLEVSPGLNTGSRTISTLTPNPPPTSIK